MALPICVEVFIRILLHTLNFALHYWFWVLIFILLLSFLRTPLGIGLVGWLVNMLGLLPIGITNYMGPFFMAIVWGMMLMQAPINIVLRIILLPLFVAAGFAWDALSNWGYVVFGEVPLLGAAFWLLNLIPLTPIVAFCLITPTLKYVVSGVVTFFWVQFWVSGGCKWLNIILKTIEVFFKWLYSG